MKILIWVKDFLLHLTRRLLQIFFGILIPFICGIIYIVTYEPHTYKRVTKRKIRRIRALTKLKLYTYKYFKPICRFLHDNYLDKLYNKFHFLIDK